jgi:hypothetical protein
MLGRAARLYAAATAGSHHTRAFELTHATAASPRRDGAAPAAVRMRDLIKTAL